MWSSVCFAAELLGFESAESFFLLADAVGDSFEAGAEVADFGGECGEGARVVVDGCHLAEQPLRLPTFTVEEVTLFKRVTLIAEEARIARVCYPVFPRQAIFSTRG